MVVPWPVTLLEKDPLQIRYRACHVNNLTMVALDEMLNFCGLLTTSLRLVDERNQRHVEIIHG